MRWLPRWVGEAYCKLYASFGSSPFTLEGCSAAIGKPPATCRAVLSELVREGYARSRREGRRAVYVLEEPSTVVLSVGGGLKRLEAVRQREYVPLLRAAVSSLLRRLGWRLVSVVLYGSLARGTAHAHSDVDLLVVAEGLPSSFSERIRQMLQVAGDCEGECRRLWRERGIYANLQLYPLTPEEAREARPSYLDMLADGIVLFDRGGFIEGVFSRVRRRLEELGARRVQLPTGGWYWVLKPKLERGEVVEV